MKTYEQFINDKITYYHDNYDYESIFAYDGSNILAYITTGAITDENKLEGFNQPGTIWRDINAPRGTGSILYKLFIKNFGKIIPTDNISDNAKKMYKKLYEDPTIIKTSFNVGYRYKEENYLNNSMTLTQLELNKLPEIKENKDINLSNKLAEIINKTKNEIFAEEEKNYNIGQSKVRDELMIKTGKYKSVEEIPYMI